MKDKFSFWLWLFRGSGAGPGIKNLYDPWLILHVVIGLVVACCVDMRLFEVSKAVLLPLAGLFIGLSFAWAGSAVTLLQTDDLLEMSEEYEGGFVGYVFSYQLSILLLLISVVVWGLAGLELFECFYRSSIMVYFGIEAFLYALLSISIRESWSLVLTSQWFLLSYSEMRKVKRSKDKDSE